jgi:putative endopeptidase
MPILHRASSRVRNAASVALAITSLWFPCGTLAQPQSPPTRAAGLDIAAMDRSVTPGNDFFRYANGGWVKATEIPPDQKRWGVFSALEEEANRRTAALLEQAAKANAPAGSDERKVGDFYASYMDEGAIDAKGLGGLRAALNRIATLKDRTALAKVLGEQMRADVDPLNNTRFETSRLFGLWVSPDLTAPDRYAAYLLQGGLGMPSRAYYLDDAPRMADIRAKYQEHIATVLRLAGIPKSDAKAARILELERKMAQVQVSREESVDVAKANNPWRREEFPTRAPGLDWAAFFNAAGLGSQSTIIVWQPSGVTGLSALVASAPLETWRAYLAFHLVDRSSNELPAAFVAEYFAFYGNVLTGTPQLSPRWKRAVTATNAALGDAVGKLYVKRHFPPEAKAQVAAMVKNIIAAFDRRIDQIDWMAPQTKAKAKEKLTTLYIGVGYPDRWIDYSSLEVVRGDALGNVERAELFAYRRRLAELTQRVDLTEWWMTPQTVNAVNLPLQNAMNFPAAILQAPFFDPAASAAINYAAIGSIIGHEISHSFDNQGALFDAHGKLADWWTPEDLAHFRASGAQLAAQYDAYHPFPDLAVNGKLTLSENIADLAGLSASHEAWLLSLGGKPAPEAQGFSGEQQFFISFAQAKRSKTREAAQRQLVLTDAHAPSEYRTDTVRNLDAWYPAFDVQPGDALYLAPKDRVRVW